MLGLRRKTQMVDSAQAPPGHDQPMPVYATQHRSAIFPTTDEQRVAAEASRDAYAQRLREAGYPAITTEITKAGPFYYAEDYHQQEPVGLLRAGRDRRELPGRRRSSRGCFIGRSWGALGA